MSDIIDGKPTMTFWFLSGAALIWNLFGMMIYWQNVTMTPETIAEQFTPEQAAFLQSVPVWATSAFAIAVTAGVLGSLMLLFRKAWAMPLFVVSLVAVLVQNLHSFVLNDSIALFGMTPVYIQSAIVVIAVLLIFFSRGAKARGWLT